MDEQAQENATEVDEEPIGEENATKKPEEGIFLTEPQSTHERRRRSWSDTTSLKSESDIIGKDLRKNKSFTLFPHIKEEHPNVSITSLVVHRTSSFRLMPHLSGDLSGDIIPDFDFPTVSVLNFCSMDGEYSDETSSESELPEEDVLHSWHRPTDRKRSASEPIPLEAVERPRTWSLPRENTRLPAAQETMYKVTMPPSRLHFQKQLDKLKEEPSTSSQEESRESVDTKSSSIMSLVNNSDSEFVEPRISSLEVIIEEVTGHWASREQRQSVTESLSVPEASIQPITGNEDEDEDTGENDSIGDIAITKVKEIGRRATLSSMSPLKDSPKYASQLEQEAFRKIRKWKADFAVKLDKVLGQRFKKQEEDDKIKPRKQPKVFNVPMNLSAEEMRKMKFNLIHELKRKSIGLDGDEVSDDNNVFPPPPPPIPRVPFPKKPSADQNPANLRDQMMKELRRRVSVIADNGEDENEEHCMRPTSLVCDLNFHPSAQRMSAKQPYPTNEPRNRILQPEIVRDLLNWQQAERERLKKELEMLPRTQGGQRVLIDREDTNRILQSMMKMMEYIFRGTINRLMEIDIETTEEMQLSSEAGEVKSLEGEEKNETAASTPYKPAACQLSENDKKGGLVYVPLEKKITEHEVGQSLKAISSLSSCDGLLSSESSLTGLTFSSSSASQLDEHDEVPTSPELRNESNSVSEDNGSSVDSESVSCLSHSTVSDEMVKETDQLVDIDSIELAFSEEEDQNHTNKTNEIIAVLLPTEETHAEKTGLDTVTEVAIVESAAYQDVEQREEFVEVLDNDGEMNASITENQRQIAEIPQTSSNEVPLTVGSLSLPEELSNSSETADSWLKQCIIQNRQQIEELRQEMSNMAGLINKKDAHIQKLLESNTQNEMLVRELRGKLSDATNEICLLQSLQSSDTINAQLRQEISSMSELINKKDEQIQKLLDTNTKNERLVQQLREKISDATKDAGQRQQKNDTYQQGKFKASCTKVCADRDGMTTTDNDTSTASSRSHPKGNSGFKTPGASEALFSDLSKNDLYPFDISDPFDELSTSSVSSEHLRPFETKYDALIDEYLARKRKSSVSGLNEKESRCETKIMDKRKSHDSLLSTSQVSLEEEQNDAKKRINVKYGDIKTDEKQSTDFIERSNVPLEDENPTSFAYRGTRLCGGLIDSINVEINLKLSDLEQIKDSAQKAAILKTGKMKERSTNTRQFPQSKTAANDSFTDSCGTAFLGETGLAQVREMTHAGRKAESDVPGYKNAHFKTHRGESCQLRKEALARVKPKETRSVVNKQIGQTQKNSSSFLETGKDQDRSKNRIAQAEGGQTITGHRFLNARGGQSNKRNSTCSQDGQLNNVPLEERKLSNPDLWRTRTGEIRQFLSDRLGDLFGEKKSKRNEKTSVFRGRGSKESKGPPGTGKCAQRNSHVRVADDIKGSCYKNVTSWGQASTGKSLQCPEKQWPYKASLSSDDDSMEGEEPLVATTGSKSVETPSVKSTSSSFQRLSAQNSSLSSTSCTLSSTDCSFDEENDIDILRSIYKTTKDILRTNKKQEKAIQSCKNKIHLVTEEVKHLRERNAKVGVTPSKGGSMRAGSSTWTEIGSATRLF